MLLDSVKRYDTKQQVKLCCVEQIRKTNPRVLHQITAVPALLLIGQNNSRELLFGKDVFDYLLLPSRGRLMQPNLEPKTGSPDSQPSSANFAAGAPLGEPMGFELASGAGSSGHFTYIESEDSVFQGRAYAWSSISDGGGAVGQVGSSAPVVASPLPAMAGRGAAGGGDAAVAAVANRMSGIGLETRTKEELPSMDSILANRDSDVAFLRPKQPPPTDLRL